MEVLISKGKIENKYKVNTNIIIIKGYVSKFGQADIVLGGHYKNGRYIKRLQYYFLFCFNFIKKKLHP